MPAEPAAVPSPKAKLRCSGATLRANAARTMPKEPEATPRPTSTPPPRCSIVTESELAIITSPTAYITPDSASTRHVPNLSASAPKIGVPSPHARFWIAIANPNVVRSQPFSASIGNWKKPIAERGPKVSAAIRQPHMMISQGRLGAPDWAETVFGMHGFPNDRVRKLGHKRVWWK